jgi:hypothetical protein
VSSTPYGNEITVSELGGGLHVFDPEFGWSQDKKIMCMYVTWNSLYRKK